MEKCIKVTGIDHSNSLLLIDHTLVNEVAGDLKRRLSGTLTVTGLEHIELARLNGEFHVLHITVVILKDSTNLFKLSESLGELVRHFGNRHRSTNACNNVLALCVCKELAHKSALTCSGVASEGNACTAIVAHITERHHLYVNSGTPRIRNIVVAAVNVSTGVVPRTENSLNSAH